jgi:hypothetical protein
MYYNVLESSALLFHTLYQHHHLTLFLSDNTIVESEDGDNDAREAELPSSIVSVTFKFVPNT